MRTTLTNVVAIMAFNSLRTVVLVCMILLPVAIFGDYQLEVELKSYDNSGGRRQGGDCCDAMNPVSGFCLLQLDTCDTRISFSIQNIDTGTRFPSETEVVGPYDNTDIINFVNCQQFVNGPNNPLTFRARSSDWGTQDRLRLTAEVSDIDRDPFTGTISREQIATVIIDVGRPGTPTSAFTSFHNFSGSNDLTIELRYRVICTDGTCGNTCSQTVNCGPQPFTPACSVVNPINCDAAPCQNDGTCQTVSGGYRCTCPPTFTGINCESRVLTTTTASVTDDDTTTTEIEPDTSISTTSQSTRPGPSTRGTSSPEPTDSVEVTDSTMTIMLSTDGQQAVSIAIIIGSVIGGVMLLVVVITVTTIILVVVTVTCVLHAHRDSTKSSDVPIEEKGAEPNEYIKVNAPVASAL